MLSVAFEFESQDGTGQFELRLTPTGQAGPALVTAHLPDQKPATQLEVDGPPLWSECAYKTINRALHTASAQIDELLKGAQIQKLTISIKAVSNSDAKRPELSKINFISTEGGGNVYISGLVGGVVFSINTERRDLYSVTTKIFAFCSLPWPGASEPLRLPSVPVYRGGAVDDFIFVNELPAGAARWFVAFEAAYKRKFTYRDGVVAPLETWQAFQCGEV